jgi:chromosome segregation ATPase
LIKAGERIAELECERNNLVLSTGEHITVRSEYLARAEVAEAEVADLERALGCEQRALVAEAEAHLKALSRAAEAVKRIAELERRASNAEAHESRIREQVAKVSAAWSAAEAKVAERDTIIQALKDQSAREADAKAKVQAYRVAAEARVKALEESLTPSPSTKMAYEGMFYFDITNPDDRGAAFDEVEHRIVPWTVIKQIMAAILSRAAFSQSGEA